MAVRINLANTVIGASFPTAYAKITQFVWNGRFIRYYVAVFIDEQARQSDKHAVREDIYNCPLPSGEILPALYADLKTREDYIGAEDC